MLTYSTPLAYFCIEIWLPWKAQCSNILEDNNVVATSIFGIELEEFSSKRLRVICSKLNTNDIRNAKKPEVVERIVKSYKNKKAYDAMMTRVDSKLSSEERGISSRKQIQYLFWRLNVLFSDDFVEDFATLGNVSSWQLLDSGEAGQLKHILLEIVPF